MTTPHGWLSLPILALSTLLQINTARCEDGLPTFDAALLASRQKSYAKGILENYDEVIIPKLLPQEVIKLQNLQFEFPARLEGREPLAFATDGKTIFMSTSSLIFLDEIATASAWLQRMGYSQATLSNYAMMLRYGRLGNDPPSPLNALCIPSHATKNEGVNSLAGRLFSSMVVFIMLHEIGHVLHEDSSHNNSSPAVIRMQEQAADDFALEQLARLGESPLSMTAFFTFAASYARGSEDFASPAEFEDYLRKQDHPLDHERLLALSESIERNAPLFAASHEGGAVTFRAVSLGIKIIATTLADPDSRMLMGRIGRTATNANLAPLKFSEALGVPCVSHGPFGEGKFAGYFGGTFIGGKTVLAANAVFNQIGNNVTGSLSYGAGTVWIEGKAKGEKLNFTWSLLNDTGRGTLEVNDGGLLVGNWGFNGEESGGGSLEFKALPMQ